MFSSQALKQVVTELRPIIERQLADGELITAMREAVTAQGGDWSAIKALVKAQCQDDLDDSGDGKRVQKILAKSAFTAEYAEMLGLNMNEGNCFSDDDVTITDHEDADGNRLVVRVDHRIAAILAKSAA